MMRLNLRTLVSFVCMSWAGLSQAANPEPLDFLEVGKTTFIGLHFNAERTKVFVENENVVSCELNTEDVTELSCVGRRPGFSRLYAVGKYLDQFYVEKLGYIIVKREDGMWQGSWSPYAFDNPDADSELRLASGDSILVPGPQGSSRTSTYGWSKTLSGSPDIAAVDLENVHGMVMARVHAKSSEGSSKLYLWSDKGQPQRQVYQVVLYSKPST
jgi:hypothetical protein